ncbi:MAG: type 2 lantipeptide synthetase LanM, partial [Coleofasciculus sp. S288]|nr:type 2 lantipeptide synthetase LanM [Coleofasciculus sp. S288]
MKQWIDQIASKALAPEEWRAFPETVIRPATVNLETQRLMVRWEKILLLSTNNYSIFDKRLQSLGLDRNSALEYLGDRTLPTTANLPSWAELLTEVLTASTFEQPIVPPEQLRAYSDTELEVLSLDLTRKPSFPEFLHPFISVTLRRIAQKLKHLRQLIPIGWDGKRESSLLVSSPVKDRSESLLGLEIITNTAVEQVARYLLFKLSELSARTVAYEVKQWQARGTLIGETPNSRYRYFVEKILGTPEGQQELFSKYPVLARLLAACCEQVSVITVELLERLCRDWEKLGVYFDTGSRLGQLTSLLMGLSDPHQGGRTVCCLEFASGLKLIYKPRDLAIDVAFNHLVTWLNETGEMPALRLTRILPRQGYGWSEFISSRECTTTAEVANFYQRQGIYAALFYFLCGVDFHAGNFIAHGECPVPIDLEGILSPGVHVMPGNSGQIPPGYRPLAFSALITGMLPNWRAGDSDRVLFVTSGISGNGDRELPWKEPAWEGLESDRLSLVRAYRSSRPNKNLPRLAAKTVPVNDYLDQVVRGFTLGYQTLLRHRDELLAQKSPLTAFQTVTSRCLLRDTKDYHDLLFWSTAPDQLTSGAAYDVALERLCSNLPKLGTHEFAFTTKDENLSVSVSPCPRVSASTFKTRLDVSLVDDEKRCLWQRDIPIYYGTPSERSLSASNGNVYENAFEQPSYIQMKQRFQEATQEDLHWQLEVLNASFQMSFQPKGSPLQLNPDEEGLKARLLAHAVAIGDVLERLALCDCRGNSWLTLYRVSKMSRAVEYAIADPWLYSGTAGIAVFLANLAAHTGERRYEKLARGALNYSESVIRWWVERGDEIALSGYNGIFSVVYALTECGRCLKDESLIER